MSTHDDDICSIASPRTVKTKNLKIIDMWLHSEPVDEVVDGMPSDMIFGPI